MNVYGPKGIKEIITLQLKLANSWTNYNLFFHELDSKTSQIIFEDDDLLVKTIPLDHRVYTNGFLFQEKSVKRRLDMQKIEDFNIKPYDYQNLKLGKDLITEEGKIIQNQSLTLEPHPVKTYAFCSDTSYNESIVPLIEYVDLLYHEATFLDSHANLAKKTKHSTAKQAAKIAKLSKVKRLILGHFSSRYNDKSQFIREAKSVFEKVELASDGKIIHL